MEHAGGRLEVIVGSMFSGKSEELIRRVRRAKIARQQVQVFKPALDHRYSRGEVVSHGGDKVQAIGTATPGDIPEWVDPATRVIAIDEVQFFDESVVHVTEALVDEGLRVICAGLDQDFRGEPFGPVPTMMALADDVIKLNAICVQCGHTASRTQRLLDGQPAAYDEPVILVGAAEVYEARCRRCHAVPGRPDWRLSPAAPAAEAAT